MSYCGFHVTVGQTVQEIHDGGEGEDADDGIEPGVVGLFLDAFGVEPTILDDGNLTTLFQSGVVVVNLFDERTVAPHDVYLGDGDAHIVEGDALDVQFLDFPLQRFLAPDVVFIVAVEHA